MRTRLQDGKLDQRVIARLTTCPIGDLLDELDRIGLRLAAADNNKLEFKGSRRHLTPEHRMALRQRKPEVVAYLRGQRLLNGKDGEP